MIALTIICGLALFVVGMSVGRLTAQRKPAALVKFEQLGESMTSLRMRDAFDRLAIATISITSSQDTTL